MAVKRIRLEDILGVNFYQYGLTTSNTNPSVGETITITCTLRNAYNDIQTGKTLTLYKNGVIVNNATTNSNGVATWTVTCNDDGLQVFKVGTETMNIFVGEGGGSDLSNLSIDLSMDTMSNGYLKIEADINRGDI